VKATYNAAHDQGGWMTATCGEVFEVTGWQGTGGVTLGFRFGAENAQRFVDPAWKELVIELDLEPHAFPIRGSFWRRCPEVRGAAITAWLMRHGLAPWPAGRPPRVRLRHLWDNRFAAELPDARE
jgi:hypothetical protein